MTSFLNACAAQLVAMLPRGTRKAIIDRAIGGYAVGYDSFCEVAETLNVVAVSIRGEYGVIQNAVSDRVMSEHYAKTGRWAKQTNDAFIGFFAGRGGTYIDVGANVGLTTIPVARNPRVSCVALEPEPGNFSFLTANIAANCPHGNVVIKRAAAFERHDTLHFEISPDNHGDHRIRLRAGEGQLREQDRKVIEIEALPLDDLLQAPDGPLAIKVDTQGAEPFVVKGGRRLLSSAELLILEFWPYAMARMGGDPEDVIQLLERDFATISMYDGEESKPSAPEPVSNAAGKLRRMVRDRVGDHHFYVDIAARKA